jgi:Type II CAAX prenyl endopeptidase Rce1-like
MLLFYHGIGLLLMLIGSSVAEKVISDYKEPSIPLSLTSVLSAGPIEETIFYGIPFYVFGNNLVVLAGGIAWAMIHILNTNTPSFSNLAYANWLFVVPSLFFSLRTWISGKGWFAILTHSAWNGIFFMLGCAFGETSCVNISSEKIFAVSIGSIILSGTLLSLTYLLYKRHHDKETQRLAT